MSDSNSVSICKATAVKMCEAGMFEGVDKEIACSESMLQNLDETCDSDHPEFLEFWTCAAGA